MGLSQLFPNLKELKMPPFKPSLGVIPITGCCGVRVIYGLEKYVQATVAAHREAFVKYLEKLSDEGIKEGICLITLNHLQTKYWHPVVSEAGFSCVERGHNRNTGHGVFIYTKVVHETTKKETDK